ncbi:MAG: efflux RND transporter permease subunit [Alistipes sp.]|nr:efflux RND transporter permease subunit [Candidatus Alistipes equi]
MHIPEFFLKRPVLFWSMMIGVLIAGVISYLWMPKLEDPVVPVKQAMVIVVYPGASAEQMELQVAILMEEKLRSLPDVKKIKTECQPSMASFTVEFDMKISKDDLEQYFDLLRRKAADVEAQLPRGCMAPIVVDDMMDVYGSFYALSSSSYDYRKLYDYAGFIRRELQAVKGVKRVNIYGARKEVINIYLNKEDIASNGMLPMQVISAVQDAGKALQLGDHQIHGTHIRLDVTGNIENEQDIRRLLVTTTSGKKVPLGEIARIEREYEEPFRNAFYINGQKALAISVAMEDDAIVPDVGKLLDKKLDEVMRMVPAGIEIEKIFFQADKVNEAIDDFLLNLLESVIIVVLVLVFAMGLRSGLIIGFGLFLTIAASFPVLSLMDTTLQRISLGAFIVAMGMLVDNAVVIMDGILLDRGRGLKRENYLFRIGKQTAGPLLGATIVAVSVFLAVYLSPGSVGEYAKDLFVVLAVSLLLSWVFALVQVPICADCWLGRDGLEKSVEQVQNTWMHRFIKQGVTSMIRHKFLSISIAVVLLLGSIFALTRVRNVFFPDFNYGQFIIECTFPSTKTLESVRQDMLQMESIIRQNENVRRVAVSTGTPPARYCFVRPMSTGGDFYAEFIVDCKDYPTITREIPPMMESLRAAYPEVYMRARKYNFSISTSHPVEIAVEGPDPAVLRSLCSSVEKIMRESRYVDYYSVQNNWKPKAKHLNIEFDELNGQTAGISRQDLASSMEAAQDGKTIGVLYDKDLMVLLNLCVREKDGKRIEDLGQIPVWSMLNLRPMNMDPTSLLSGDGVMKMKDDMFRSVPLSSVSLGESISWHEDYILRQNGRRIIEAECDPSMYDNDATPASLLRSVESRLKEIPVPEGYDIHPIGEKELQAEAIGGLFRYIPLTLFIILTVLLLLFGAWRKVILVLMILPFGIVGVSWGLLLTGVPFTFMGTIGIFGLTGMMIKNEIVLLDEISRLTGTGIDPFMAIIEATLSRVRPVMMASLTTIVGMLPLITDPMYGSLSVTIMGGLLVGTLITLLLFPLLYATFYKVNPQNTLN